MKVILAFAFAAFALTTTLPVLAQVRDARPVATVAPAPTGTAAISGIVMSADTSPRPLRSANVVLIGGTTGVLKVTATDRDGRFAFTSLPADRYTVGASKPPFLGAVVGARRPARPGTPIVLTPGQRVSDAVIRLPPAAAISGVITDELGQPTAAAVTLQQRKMQNGERVLVSTGHSTTTDERGRYRIFGLAPGEYFVAAIRMAAGATTARVLTSREVDGALRGELPPPTPPQPPVRYVPIYYPGTARPADAGGIALAVGDDRADIDIRLELANTAVVDGTVVTPDGQTPMNTSVILSSAGGSPLQQTVMANVGPNGRFSFPSVMPGLYMLVSTSSGALFASQFIDVTGDLIGLQLTLKPPMTLKGRIAFDGTSAAPSLSGWLPTVKPLSKTAGIGFGPVTPPSDAQGNFTVPRLAPGPYMIVGPTTFGPNANSVTWSLQSVMADGKDVTDLPIDITAETLPKDLVLTFTDATQTVTGRLMQSGGAPATDYTVILFPKEKAYWLTGSRRILVTRPDSNGQFSFGGPGLIALPAGEYFLAAVVELDRDEQFDPALLATLMNAAAPLTIQPGERKVQDLVIR
jgi:hypothetical protein